MRTLVVYKILASAIFVGMCVSYACAEEEKNEMMQSYAADLTKYIAEAQADLQETEQCFAEEKSDILKNTSYNERILELKKEQIGIMKSLLVAVGSQDFEQIEELERQQEIKQHMLNLVGTEKDMALVIGDLKKQAASKKVDDPQQLAETIKDLETTFHGIIATEEAVFSETLRLKSLYKEKEKKLAECYQCLEGDAKK